MPSSDDFDAQREEFWSRRASQRRASQPSRSRDLGDRRSDSVQARPRGYSESGYNQHSPFYPPPTSPQPISWDDQRRRQSRAVSDASADPRSFDERDPRHPRRASSVQRPPSSYRPPSVQPSQPPLYKEETHRSYASQGSHGDYAASTRHARHARSASNVSGRHPSIDERDRDQRYPPRAYTPEKHGHGGYVSPTPMRYAEDAKRKVKPAAYTAGGAVVGASGVVGAHAAVTHDDTCCGFDDCFGCGDCDGCGDCGDCDCGDLGECFQMCEHC